MDGWDKVFTTGWHTDSNGNKKYWSREDLDKIVDTFTPSYHEPPITIGHPADNAPAFGWVEGIKRVGEDLYLKYKDVADEFKEWVAKGFYKKKSISVYPDGSLRHVAYLGGMPPAIKGLPNFQFSDAGKGEAAIYEFSDWRMSTVGRVIMKLRDYLVEKEGADKADQVIGSWDVQDLLTPPPEPADDSCYNQHEEEDMKLEEVQALIEKTLTGVTLQFSELLKPVNETITGLRNELTSIKEGQVADRAAGQRREFAEFLATPEMLRRVPEGSREATINQMLTLASAKPLEFGEGDQKKTVSALDHYKEQLQALPPVVEFNEFATGDRAHNRQPAKGDDAVTLARKASEFQESEAKAGRTVTVTQALLHVEAEADKGGAK